MNTPKHYSWLLAVCLIASAALHGHSQELLTNESIISMASAKVGRNIIAEKIRMSEADFDLSTTALVTLKEAKIHDSVVEQMLLKAKDALPVVTNDDIIILSQGKVSRGIIIKKIQLSKTDFSVGANDLIEFKSAKVHDAVVKEIMLRAN